MAIDLKTKLSAYWSADGTYADSHGSQVVSQVGTVGSGVGHVYPAAWSFGGLGSGNRLQTVFAPDLAMGGVSFSVSAWVNPASLTGTQGICNKWTSPVSEWTINLVGVFPVFQIRDGTLFPAATGTALTIGTSYHLFAWVDVSAATVNLSVNGGAAATAAITSTGIPVNTSGLTEIGARSVNTNTYSGLIGPVAIWRDRVLTADERAYVYNGGAGRPYSEFVEAGSRRILSSHYLIGRF